MDRRIRVLVVDDSAFARKVVREVLQRDPGIEVVDVARDGFEALEKIATLRPDVVTLDLVMPELDGLAVLRALPKEHPPKVLVVSFSDGETELGIQALHLGALEIVKKPTALATDRMYQLSSELLEKVRAISTARVSEVPEPPAPPRPPIPVTRTRLLVIGTSTGGPQALTHLLPALPAELPVPVAVALHIPAGYTGPLAARLDTASAIRVVEAEDGMPLRPGVVAIAPGGQQLKIAGTAERPVARLDLQPVTPYTPSVDVLFRTAVKVEGDGTLAVVLTGMGDDGLEGAREIRARGGRVLVEAEESCVVYGMPRAVAMGGLADAQVPLEEMSREILRRL